MHLTAIQSCHYSMEINRGYQWQETDTNFLFSRSHSPLHEVGIENCQRERRDSCEHGQVDPERYNIQATGRREQRCGPSKA